MSVKLFSTIIWLLLPVCWFTRRVSTGGWQKTDRMWQQSWGGCATPIDGGAFEALVSIHTLRKYITQSPAMTQATRTNTRRINAVVGARWWIGGLDVAEVHFIRLLRAQWEWATSCLVANNMNNMLTAGDDSMRCAFQAHSARMCFFFDSYVKNYGEQWTE